jgi:hypothetical protein
LVWLEGKNLKTLYASKKIAPRREGLFKISEVLGPLTYKLILPMQWKIHPMFHASFLTCYQENKTHGQNFTKPPVELLDGEEEFEMEAIIAHRKQGCRLHFLIRWKGYPTSNNLWEPQNNLKHAQKILVDYKMKYHF